MKENLKNIFSLLQTNEQNSGEVGLMTLVMHGTNEMPAHMKDGPRKYIHDGNYQELFNYFGEFESGHSDDSSAVSAPEEQITEEVDVNNIDPTILAEVEQELQRIHHRLVINRNIGL